jgi:CRISPR-associated endonuclease Csn1
MERGLVYMAEDESNSAMHAAGYLRRDQLQRRLFDKLPDPRRTANSPIGDIPNPVVKRTLTEIRKVVNAIIREYGKPAAVHLEMARSLQMSAEKRKEYNKQIRDKEAERSDVADKLREHGQRATRENILRYLLWEAQNQECIYSGKPISMSQLLGDGGGIEIDHILPKSRSLDDSQMNKVVCFRTANADKGDQTPYEWLAARDPKKYDEVCQRAKKLLYTKYRRFLQKELELDKFIARQLTDTAYITKATSEYLKCLFEQDHSVLGLKGQLTAELRWHWGLETVLKELPDSPAWQEACSGKLRPGEKNRADHRHHAIDAVVLALTNRSRLHQLSDIVKRGGARAHGEVLDDPWPKFRDDVVQAIKKTNVSHRVERKVAGALHADSHYGPTQSEGVYVKRKPIVDLSGGEIDEIRDDAIKELVVENLRKNGIELRCGEKLTRESQGVMKLALSNIKMKSGVPVKRVRLLIRDKTIRPIRKDSTDRVHVKPDSTHHLCIFRWNENGKIKRDAVFVTMLRAVDCLKLQNRELTQLAKTWKKGILKGHDIDERKRTAMREISVRFRVIQRDANKLEEWDAARIPRHAQFVMSLSNGELVLLEIDGRQRLAKMRTSKSTENKIKFSLVEDARKTYRPINVNINTLFTKYHARKVTVDPLGRIRWAND